MHINHGKSPVGWTWNNRYFMADGNVYGEDGRNHLVRYDSVSDLWNGTNYVDYGTSSVDWSRINPFFCDNSMNGIALNAQGNLITASAPLALGLLGMCGLFAARRRKA